MLRGGVSAYRGVGVPGVIRVSGYRRLGRLGRMGTLAAAATAATRVARAREAVSQNFLKTISF